MRDDETRRARIYAPGVDPRIVRCFYRAGLIDRTLPTRGRKRHKDPDYHYNHSRQKRDRRVEDPAGQVEGRDGGEKR